MERLLIQAIELAQLNKQTIGDEHDYYITITQLESLLQRDDEPDGDDYADRAEWQARR
jgi:hypothetical protein